MILRRTLDIVELVIVLLLAIYFLLRIAERWDEWLLWVFIMLVLLAGLKLVRLFTGIFRNN